VSATPEDAVKKESLQHEINKFIKRNSTGDVLMASTVHCGWLAEVQAHPASFFSPVCQY